MLTQKPGALSVKAQVSLCGISLSGKEADYALVDLAPLTVTGLPAAGIVLKADRLTGVVIGDTLSAAELAALTFAPKLGEASPWNGAVLYVQQHCGRLPIPLLANLPAGFTVNTPVVITELPSNGLLFLADGLTAVSRDQVMTIAQLCGLTFEPGTDATGKISLLRYGSADKRFIREVLLIVGSDPLTASAGEIDTVDDKTSIDPVALALLLEAGLSSVISSQASAATDPNDTVPPDSSAPSHQSAGVVNEDISQVAAIVPTDIVGAATENPTQSAVGIDITGSTGTNTSRPDEPPEPPHHRIGSSVPPDSGGVPLRPMPPSNLPKTPSLNLPATATTSAPTLNSPAPQAPSLPVQNLADMVISAGSAVTSTGNVDVNSLVVEAGAVLTSNAGTLFTVEGNVIDNGTIKAGPFRNDQISTIDIKGSVNGTGSFEISNQAVLEIGGSVSGQLMKGSFSGITVSFDTANGELVLDHSAQFHGLIAGPPSSGSLAPTDMIDLKDLAFTSSMSTSISYDTNTNISTVGFSNGASTVTLQFSGRDPSWNFSSDGQGGTIISDPAPSNAIVLENELPGTPMGVWWVNPGDDSTELEGFTTSISTNIGSTLQFKIDNLTGSPNYQIQIYRLGYYGGDGARLVTTLQHTTSITQPNPITNTETGEVDAGDWSVTDSWNIPSTTVSGVYVANVVQGDQVFQIPFIVKDPNSTSDIVFQTSDETWQAYNGWGGANLYGGDGPSNPPSDEGGDEIVPGAAFAVSYNRPIMTRDDVGQFANSNDTLFGGEYPAIYWLEETGYDVSYISGMDTATDGALLLNHKVFMDAGHDEYWTDSQVANVQAAANAGVNLVFLSGNEIFWQTQFTPSIDGSNTANRTLVTYKDSHFEQLMNPSGQGTGAFEAPTSWGGAATPSNALTGTVFSVDESGSLGTITIPYDMTQLRFWRGTSVAATTPGQTASLENGLLGYEWDSSPDNGFMPAGLIDLSSTTLQEPTAFNTEFGNVDTSGTATHNLVEYRDPTSGALVFGAGTVFWSWGLSGQHDPSVDGDQTDADPNVQQAMVNLFADMGVQPETLQASLVIASASTDHTPPTSKITSVSSLAAVEGQTVTVNGTATDVGGVIGGVQISTDSGKTWHVTSGQIGTQTVNWSYTFNAPAAGTYSIETRAVDDSLNLETPGSGVSYSVSPSTDLSLFGSGATPATANMNDTNAVEVGLKFTSSSNGQITGIRFYKGSLNTGAHVVDLWTAGGTLLASATSTNETASGWQQVNFSSPVNIVAGTTYVASYHTTNGEYADTPFYFDTLQNPANGSLSATANGLNGVYAYSSGSMFPDNVSDSGDNYWVDVVLNDSSTATETSPVLETQTPSQTAVAGSTFSLTLPADTFNDPDGGALTYSATGLNGAALPSWLTFNAATRTFSGTPASADLGNVGVEVTATDPANLSASETFNIAVAATAPTSLFTASSTPTLTTVNDHSPIELGVQFTSSVAGQITALKFYRSASDTGTDLLDLWSATGTQLASVTFTNTTASGWQTVNLATPISIAANTTYVASYHTNGAYVATGNFFTNTLTSGALTAPSSASVSGGNGVYSYGGTSTEGLFPTSTFGASNYYADVVFSSTTTTDTPPVLETQTPNQNAVAGSSFSLTLPAGTFKDPDGDALTYSATSLNGAALPAWLTFNATTRTFIGTPASADLGTVGVQVTATDPANLSASETFNIAVAATAPTTASLFTASDTPTLTAVNDHSPIEVGVQFTSSVAGQITALKFYRSASDTGTDLLDLWSSTGTQLASATFTNTTASGWQTVNLATPVSIAANTTYVASYHTDGAYVATDNFFTSALTSGTLTAPSSASISSGNGVYAYGGTSTTGLFPTSTFSASNYYADVVFSSATTTDTPPELETQTPNQNAVVGSAFSLTLPADTFNDPDGGALTYSATGLNGAALPTWLTFNATTQTFSGTPTSANIGTVGVQVTATDPANLSASETFDIAVATTAPTTASLFTASDTPTLTAVNDHSPIELGVQFTSSEAGQITALKFYRSASDTGPDVLDLWSSTGTQLASVTFTNTTASGWQTVNLATPISIAANTTYVASYHTNGAYVATDNFFSNALTNGTLTAPSSASVSGGNGVYAYGGTSTEGLFPRNSFSSANYYADVVFQPQLAG